MQKTLFMFFFARGGRKGEAVTFGRGGPPCYLMNVEQLFPFFLRGTYCVRWTTIIAEKHLFIPLATTVQTVDSRGWILLRRSRRSIEAGETVMVYTVGVRCLFRMVSSFRFKQIEGCKPSAFWKQYCWKAVLNIMILFLWKIQKMTATEKYTVHVLCLQVWWKKKREKL